MRSARCGRAPAVTVLVFTLSYVLAACTATRPLTPRAAPAVLPSAAELEAGLAARRDAVRSLRALARLRYRDAEQSVTSREAIVVARPDRVRVEVLSIFGSVFLLVADNGQMTAYARNENTVYRGQASPQNLQRYVRLGVPVDELVDIVLGTPPARDGRAQVSFDEAAGAIRLRRWLDQGSQTVWFSEASLPLATEEAGADGRARWRATFAEYEDHAGVPIATRIGLDLPAWSQSMEIALQDIEVNPTLDHSIFAFQAPSGSKVVDLHPLAD
jgi:outer membrane lipoprotein-sorting protein